jgi:hypothetical protein
MEDSETISADGMHLVIIKFTELGTSRADRGSGGRTLRVLSQIEPIAISVRPSTDIVSPDVVGVSDPEASRGLISVQQSLR